MMRRCRALRASLLRATRRRRGRQLDPPALLGVAPVEPDAPLARPWSVEELGATALELGLYPELDEPGARLAAQSV